MTNVFRCANERRRELVRASGALNGIDWIEVVTDAGYERRWLRIHCFLALSGATPLVVIEGGPDSLPVEVVSAPIDGEHPDTLYVSVARRGDEGRYRLRLLATDGSDAAPAGFDPPLCEVEFSFQVGCECDEDCATPVERGPAPQAQPVIDYMARDAESFQRLMFDRLALTTPSWTERNPADLGVALVELFAHAGDRLSYFQDAVGTEAYLATARLRTSVRRHARLVDYALHEGCDARTWVYFHANAVKDLAARVRVSNMSRDGLTTLSPEAFDAVAASGAVVFETMHPAHINPALNELRFHAWGAEECVLPQGSTRATLRWPSGLDLRELAPGQALLLEESVSPTSGRPEDADRTRRHVVRLKRVGALQTDALPSPTVTVRDVEWDAEDALPFDLTISARRTDDGALIADTAVARGNLALADHGFRKAPITMTVPASRDPRDVVRLPLDAETVTFHSLEQVVRPDGGVQFLMPRPASRMLSQDAHAALPDLEVEEQGDTALMWTPRHDLLASRDHDRHFVVEVEQGRCFLRFGDDTHGRRPEAGTVFHVRPRVGCGRAGNVAPDVMICVEDDGSSGSPVDYVRNPLSAQGGVDPEPVEQAKRIAPTAFRWQERAVTLDDWASVAERHPEVKKAVATRRWTGSWSTVFVTVDRRGGQPVDAAFSDDLRGFLERFRLAGCDLNVNEPRFVPVEIGLTVCVADGAFRGDVKRALHDAFSRRELSCGKLGFFHPDNFTFGQALYLSQIIAEAVRVPGVASAIPHLFQRVGAPPSGTAQPLPELIPLAQLEVIRVDNIASNPQRGRVSFQLQGGL